MKHHLIALATVALLAACSDKPRGPQEVQGQVFMDREMPVQFEFLGRDKGRLTNFGSEKSADFRYTLEGEKLVLHIPRTDGKPDEVVELELDGKKYSGGRLNLLVKEAGDEARITRAKEAARQQAERVAKLSPKGAPRDPQAYTSVETIGDDYNDWGAWLAVSWNVEKRTDDQLLQYFSRAWSSTQDSFARQEMRAPELARIKQRLGELRKIEYLHIPQAQDYQMTRMQVDKPYDSEAYDFEKKSFHILSSACASNMSAQTRSGVTMSMEKNPAFCWLPVPDPEVARQVEAARTKGGVKVVGDFYAKLAYIDASNTMTLVPIGAQLQVLKETYRPAKPEDHLADVKIWPQH